MDISHTCRTCLTKESLCPIFENSEINVHYSTSLFLAAGVKIEQNDGMPQNMCVTCITFINTCAKFRRQCKNAENQLLQIKKKLQEHSGINDIDIKLEKINVNEKYIEIDTDYIDNYLTDEEIHHSNNLDYNLHKNNINEEDHVREVNTIEEKDGYEKELQHIICQVCSQSISLRSYEKHMTKKHPNFNGPPLKCGFCSNECENRDALTEHIENCSSKKKRGRVRGSSVKQLVQCDLCQKTMQKASLKMHIAVKHGGLKPMCEHCGRPFGNKFRLNEHYRAKHGYEKFKCSDCDFQSASAVAMKNHERRHRGEKPFVCEACGAKFHAAYLLAQHRHSHRTEKVFKCDLCPASFKANNSLHVHRASCHSRALHRCSVCARAYSSRHYAVKHMRHVHRYSGAVPQLQTVPNSVQEIAEDIYELQEKVEPL